MVMRISLALLIFGAGPLCASAHHAYMPGSETNGLSAMLREIYAGSKLREFLHMFTSEPLPDEVVGTAVGQVKHLPNGELEQTFVTMPMTLKGGEVGNKWLPMDWPKGHIAVKSYVAEVVKAGPNGEVPPPEPCCATSGIHFTTLDEVYMHHWTVNKWQLPNSLFKDMVREGGYNYHLTLQDKVGYIEVFAGAGLNAGANGPCWDSNLHLYFGIGNEVRNKTKQGLDPYLFPDPYGVVFDSEMMRRSGEFMVLNMHLVDLRDVRDTRACAECKCSEHGTHWYGQEGGLGCCHSTEMDGDRCKLKPNTTSDDATTYYIRYTLKWRPFDHATTLPLEVISFDATDNNTKWGDLPFIPGGYSQSHSALKSDPASMAIIDSRKSGDFDGHRACHIEYYVPACKKGDKCIQTLRNSWEVPYPMHIVFVRNHLHNGAINMTTYNDKYSCTGKCTYRNDDPLDFLVDISTCTVGAKDKGVIHVQRGERLYVEANYQQDDLPHYGAMAMSFVYVYVPRDQDVHV